jgi:hypothetical protein
MFAAAFLLSECAPRTQSAPSDPAAGVSGQVNPGASEERNYSM